MSARYVTANSCVSFRMVPIIRLKEKIAFFIPEHNISCLNVATGDIKAAYLLAHSAIGTCQYLLTGRNMDIKWSTLACSVLFSIFGIGYPWSLVMALNFQWSIHGLVSFPGTSTKLMVDVCSLSHDSLCRNIPIFATSSIETPVSRRGILCGRDRTGTDDITSISLFTTCERRDISRSNVLGLLKTSFNFLCWSEVKASELTVNLASSE